jgi:hypothetical protein
MIILDNFLTEKECNFLINYYNKHCFGECSPGSHSFLTLTLKKQWRTVPIYHFLHFRVNYLRRKIISKVFEMTKNKLQYDTICHWPNKSFMQHHYDYTDTPYAVICYLNDDYIGGETVIGDQKIIPKRGRMILYDGLNNLHGVNSITGNRYTYTAWFY